MAAGTHFAPQQHYLYAGSSVYMMAQRPIKVRVIRLLKASTICSLTLIIYPVTVASIKGLCKGRVWIKGTPLR